MSNQQQVRTIGYYTDNPALVTLFECERCGDYHQILTNIGGLMVCQACLDDEADNTYCSTCGRKWNEHVEEEE